MRPQRDQYKYRLVIPSQSPAFVSPLKHKALGLHTRHAGGLTHSIPSSHVPYGDFATVVAR